MTADEFATQVAASFGMSPKSYGREKRVCCPVHEADGGVHKPSLAIWDKGIGRFAFRCLTGCSNVSVRHALKDRGISIPGSGPVTTEQMMANAAANETRRIESLTKAWQAYSASRTIGEGGVVEDYLRSRAIDVTKIPNELGTLRASSDGDKHAMVGVIADLTTLRNGTPKATGIMTLALNQDGTPWLDAEGRKLRSIVGTQKGFGVPFGVPGPHLVVAEGVETMLSAMILLNIPFGVATLSAANMSSLVVPEWVEKIWIARDRDEPGQGGAKMLQEALRGIVPVEIIGWDGPDGWDANDELMKGRT